jgi:hypothetical protein
MVTARCGELPSRSGLHALLFVFALSLSHRKRLAVSVRSKKEKSATSFLGYFSVLHILEAFFKTFLDYCNPAGPSNYTRFASRNHSIIPTTRSPSSPLPSKTEPPVWDSFRCLKPLLQEHSQKSLLQRCLTNDSINPSSLPSHSFFKTSPRKQKIRKNKTRRERHVEAAPQALGE